ncbi:MAG: hypothetical protein CHACPFDD_01831 [Phycisphaerae bacterium]|nr:hypothetical protein [Phycisphaerae bacterium]
MIAGLLLLASFASLAVPCQPNVPCYTIYIVHPPEPCCSNCDATACPLCSGDSCDPDSWRACVALLAIQAGGNKAVRSEMHPCWIEYDCYPPPNCNGNVCASDDLPVNFGPNECSTYVYSGLGCL